GGRLTAPLHPLREHTPAVRVELGENVVEQEERRESATLGDQLSLGEQQGQHSQPLLALRAETAQVAAGARQDDVVEVRPEPRRSALEIAVEPCLATSHARPFP